MIEMIIPLAKISPETIHDTKYKKTEKTTEIPVINSVAFTTPTFLNNFEINNFLTAEPDIVIGKIQLDQNYTGMIKEKVVPFPSPSLSAQIWPPCS